MYMSSISVRSMYYVLGLPRNNTKQMNIQVRVRPRFFDQVGHETMYASSGNKHFFTKSSHYQTYQIMNRGDKNWAQF